MKLLLRTLGAKCKARDVVSSDARPERLGSAMWNQTDHAALMKPEVLHAYKAHAVYMYMLIHDDTCIYQWYRTRRWRKFQKQETYRRGWLL